MKRKTGEARSRRNRKLGWIPPGPHGARTQTGHLTIPLAKSPPGRHEQPASGTQLTDRISIFHDDPGEGQFACTIAAQPELRLTVYRFAGSYASIAVALRKADLRRATPSSLVGVQLEATATRPLVAFLRLNLRTSKSTETLYDTVLLDRDVILSRFDLAGARSDLQNLEAAWLDVIFSEPRMCEIDIDRLLIAVIDEERSDD